jgi:hypothetical protein
MRKIKNPFAGKSEGEKATKTNNTKKILFFGLYKSFADRNTFRQVV